MRAGKWLKNFFARYSARVLLKFSRIRPTSGRFGWFRMFALDGRLRFKKTTPCRHICGEPECASFSFWPRLNNPWIHQIVHAFYVVREKREAERTRWNTLAYSHIRGNCPHRARGTSCGNHIASEIIRAFQRFESTRRKEKPRENQVPRLEAREKLQHHCETLPSISAFFFSSAQKRETVTYGRVQRISLFW